MDKFDRIEKDSDPITEVGSRPPEPLGRSHIGRYEVLYPLAQGGMASVHVGRLSGYAGFEHLVAIKVIHPHLAGDRSFNEMLLDEARLAGLINHPNVCSVLEVGEDDGLLYLICELIMGQNLRATRYRAARRGLPIPQSLLAHIGSEICLGLHRAHEQEDKKGRPLGLVHRDVTPRNIIISYDGYVKLIDFGIALARGRIVQTAAGDKKGKIGYMPPEQIHGEGMDRRTDVFALGVVLYQMAVGKHPFPGETEAERMMRVLSGRFTPPRKANPEIHPALDKIIVRAMAQDPWERFQSAEEIGKQLRGFALGVSGDTGIAAIRSMMHELFEREIAEDEANLLHFRSQPPEAAAPLASATGGDKPLPKQVPVKSFSSSVSPRGTRDQNSRVLRVASAVLLLVVIGLFVAGKQWLFRSSSHGGLSPIAANEVPQTAQKTTSQKQIQLTLKIKPPDAAVLLDGQLLPPGTTMTTLAADGAEHILIITAPGHRPFERRFNAVADYQLIVDLLLAKTPRQTATEPHKGTETSGESALRSNPYEK